MKICRGFTLIELLVVISIIGLLSSIIMVSVSGVNQKGRDSRRVSDISTIRLALEAYYDMCGEYPKKLTMGSGNTSCNTGAATSDPNKNANGDLVAMGFLPKLPKDPTTNNEYYYAALRLGTNTTCQSFHIGATLETNSSAMQDALGKNAGTICSGSLADFNASDSSKSCAGVAGSYCYDIKP